MSEEQAVEKVSTRKATRAKKTERKARQPISGRNDRLAVEGTDPNFYYRWVLDTSEKGSNILKHTNAGYTFTKKDEGLVVGAASVYVNDHVGSHIRVPAGREGENLYLMKLPMEYREEDLETKRQTVNETEQSLLQVKPEGGYGEVKISR